MVEVKDREAFFKLSKALVDETVPRKLSKPKGVVESRVKDAETGVFETVRTVDMNSADFGEAFTYVFQKNVAEARRENKRIIGVSDVAPAK